MKDEHLHAALSHLNRGGLHRALHVAEGTKIPKEKIEAAKHSTNSHIKRMANFASVMGKWKH